MPPRPCTPADRALAASSRSFRPQPDWHVLDVATGAGHTALAFAPLVARVVASDITGEMLRAGRQARRGARAHQCRDGARRSRQSAVSRRKLRSRHLPPRRAPLPRPGRLRRRGLARSEAGRHVRARRQRRPRCDAHARCDRPPKLRDADTLYNTYEELRDPSHVRALGLDDWLGLLGDAGFTDVRHEQLDQDIAFKPWTERMRCSPETVERLESPARQRSAARLPATRARSGRARLHAAGSHHRRAQAGKP